MQERKLLQFVKLSKLPSKVPSCSKTPLRGEPWICLLVQFSRTSQHPIPPQPYQIIIYTVWYFTEMISNFSIFPHVHIYLKCHFLKPFQNQNHALYLLESCTPNTILGHQNAFLTTPFRSMLLCNIVPFSLTVPVSSPAIPQVETLSYITSVSPNPDLEQGSGHSHKESKEFLPHLEPVKVLKWQGFILMIKSEFGDCLNHWKFHYSNCTNHHSHRENWKIFPTLVALILNSPGIQCLDTALWPPKWEVHSRWDPTKCQAWH